MEVSGANGTLELGWEDERPISGRRKSKQQKLKKKLKPGSFGQSS